MLTEDYIMRMINQALYVLKKILGFKTTGHYQEALFEIEKLLEMLIGLKYDLIKRLDDHSLLDSLLQQGNVDGDRLYVIAELFKEEGEVRDALNQPEEAYLSFVRSLNFFLEAARQKVSERFPPPHDKINFLEQKLGQNFLPADTLYPLFCYYEEEGRFSEGEQTLERLRNEANLELETKKEQIAYYERLVTKTDAELAKGGIGREQIQEKLARLKNE